MYHLWQVACSLLLSSKLLSNTQFTDEQLYVIGPYTNFKPVSCSSWLSQNLLSIFFFLAEAVLLILVTGDDLSKVKVFSFLPISHSKPWYPLIQRHCGLTPLSAREHCPPFIHGLLGIHGSTAKCQFNQFVKLHSKLFCDLFYSFLKNYTTLVGIIWREAFHYHYL